MPQTVVNYHPVMGRHRGAGKTRKFNLRPVGVGETMPTFLRQLPRHLHRRLAISKSWSCGLSRLPVYLSRIRGFLTISYKSHGKVSLHNCEVCGYLQKNGTWRSNSINACNYWDMCPTHQRVQARKWGRFSLEDAAFPNVQIFYSINMPKTNLSHMASALTDA